MFIQEGKNNYTLNRTLYFKLWISTKTPLVAYCNHWIKYGEFFKVKKKNIYIYILDRDKYE